MDFLGVGPKILVTSLIGGGGVTKTLFGEIHTE